MGPFINHNRYIPPDAKLIERNGYVFIAHPRLRFDPVLTPLAVVAMGVGTTMQVAGTLKEGEQTNKLAKERAKIDIANAEATERAADEEARVKAERGRRLMATQQSQFAAGGVRLNVGAPLVIETETRQLIAKDVGYILERGREEAGYYRSRAALEIATGKAAKKQSKYLALSQGLAGFGSMAMMGSQAGWFTRKPGSTVFTGPSAGFGVPTHTGGYYS